MIEHEVVLILDYGSQYTQLIARRVRECRVYCEVLGPEVSSSDLAAKKPRAIILSGGPDSVDREGAPQLPDGLLDLDVPVLGICYGLQLLARELGGRVEGEPTGREYGHADLVIEPDSRLFAGLSERESVWMSHGDHVAEAPPGTEVLARATDGVIAGVRWKDRPVHGIQFHPEVSHTARGLQVLENFLYEIAGCRGDWTAGRFIEGEIERIRQQVGDGHVLCGISGGVDSAVAALLLHAAIGDQLHCLFVDNGLLRKNEGQRVMEAFRSHFKVPVTSVDASEVFLKELAGTTEPEAKRKTIGRVFIEVFESESKNLSDEPLRYLAQGTLYPDVIESSPVRGPSAVIKSHHNVGGLPERMNMELVEPLRWLFKDEVRRVGAELGLMEDFVQRHPFPGPGLAVRCLGELVPERLDKLREADDIFISELRKEGLYRSVAQAFAVLLPVRSVGVMGDYRTYEEVVSLRSVDSDDFMTASWSRLPHSFLARVASRIVNEVPGINRVTYDITSKPPGTIEWE
ncbi:MAG: glutamine-hydrolyzing GMP synthase [Acidobacteriota bacterium]